MAQVAPLMPKATAVWLVENTALSFDQVADFCKLHPLEVKAIADGDAASIRDNPRVREVYFGTGKTFGARAAV